MANGDDPARRCVTNGELKQELDAVRESLDEKPGRWEVRFLVAVAVVLAPSIPPASDIAQAAINTLR